MHTAYYSTTKTNLNHAANALANAMSCNLSCARLYEAYQSPYDVSLDSTKIIALKMLPFYIHYVPTYKHKSIEHDSTYDCKYALTHTAISSSADRAPPV